MGMTIREATKTLQITLRNGAVVEADVTDWKWKKGAVTSLDWDTPETAKRRLITVDISEIVAIVEVR